MLHNIQNNEFRDVAAQARHPFGADMTLTNGLITLPDDFLVDALVYLAGAEAPFYIDTLSYNATYGALQVSISDAGANKLALGLFVNDVAELRTIDGVCAGVLVAAAGVDAVRDMVIDTPAVFGPEQTGLRAGACMTPALAGGGVRAARVGTASATWSLPLLAMAGFNFETSVVHYFDPAVVTPPAAGVVRVSMYGEEGAAQVPVRSINGLRPGVSLDTGVAPDRISQHFWLAARHIRNHNPGSSGVRPSNTLDGIIRLGPSAGYSYADAPEEGSNVTP